jgi:hypothetical protein
MNYVINYSNWINESESFKLVNLSNSNWYGQQPTESYVKNVNDICLNIAMTECKVSEKSFDMIDRLSDICKKTLAERAQEFNAIVYNSKQRNMRPNYTAESVYHTLLQGKLDALKTRPFVMGGLKID